MATSKNSPNASANPFEAFMSAPAEAFSQSMQDMMAGSNPMNGLGRENFEALGESFKATASGIEAINTRTFAFMKTSMERNMAAMTALTSVKSVDEFASKQSDFVSESMQTLMTEFNEMSALVTETMRNAAEPLSAQANVFAEKIQSAS